MSWGEFWWNKAHFISTLGLDNISLAIDCAALLKISNKNNAFCIPNDWGHRFPCMCYDVVFFQVRWGRFFHYKDFLFASFSKGWRQHSNLVCKRLKNQVNLPYVNEELVVMWSISFTFDNKCVRKRGTQRAETNTMPCFILRKIVKPITGYANSIDCLVYKKSPVAWHSMCKDGRNPVKVLSAITLCSNDRF